MAHGGLAQLAAVLGAVGTVLLLVFRKRFALLAGLGLLAAAEALLFAALVPRDDLERLTRPLALAALALGAVVVGALALLFTRRPELALPALLVAAPFRIPIRVGAQDAFLLVPLYGVVAAAALAFAWRCLRRNEARALPPYLSAAIAAFVAFDACSLLWSQDMREGSVELAFFLFPFVAGVAVVARAPMPAWMPRALGSIVVGLAALFATVGIWQAWTHTIFFAQDLRVANAYTSFFRVTSVFKDPSIYGRYLVFGFAVILVALWLDRVSPPLALGALVLLFAGLWWSYSQTSMATLAVVVVAVTLAVGDRQARRVVAATAALAVVAAAVGVTVYALGHSSNRVTSGRTRLVSDTARVIGDHPLAGVGIGAQPKASRDEAGRRGRAARDASHTTPLTVAAELGIGGVVLYLALLAAAARALWEAWRRNRALGIGLAAVFLTVFVHSLFYAGFFEDPVTWGCLAVAAAVAPAAVRVLEPVAERPRTSKVAAPAR